MDFVRLLRALARRKKAVALVAVLAIAAGAGIMFSSPTRTVGTAHAMALVDTHNSQVVDLGGINSVASIATLSNRATLLTGLLTSSPLENEIAARAGIAMSSLTATSAATEATDPAPGAATGAATGGTGRSGARATPNRLTANVPELSTGQVPIITVDTRSPTAAQAARIANSSITVLRQYLESLAAKDKVSQGRRVIVRQLGPAVTATETNGPSKILAIIAVILVFVLGCGTILGISGLKAGWKRADEIERLQAGEGPVDHQAPVVVSDDDAAGDWVGVVGASRERGGVATVTPSQAPTAPTGPASPAVEVAGRRSGRGVRLRRKTR